MSDTTPKLTDEQKADVVMRLAGYDPPHAIARSLKEEFDIVITPQSIAFYDPTSYAGRACPEKWASLFYETRAKIIEGKADVGAAQRMVRLRWLDRMARRKIDEGNTVEARALLKQAADEMSEIAEQRDDGRGATYSELSGAELDARIAAAAAKLGLALVPLGAPAAAGGEGAAGEPQPPDGPLSG